jgi:hypothetical protein
VAPSSRVIKIIIRTSLALSLVVFAACTGVRWSPGPAAGLEAVAAPQPEPGTSVFEADVAFDLEAQTMSARWSVSFVADTNTAREASFLIAGGMRVEDVRGTRVRSFRVDPPEGEGAPALLFVTLDSAAAPGSVVTLEMRYAGQPSFGANQVNAISTDWVELNLDGFWHPVSTTFDQQLVGVLRVALPASWHVVSSAAVSLEGGAHVLRSRVPQVDVAFVAAPMLRRSTGELFTVHYRQADSASVATVLGIADACGAWLNERYGARAALRDGSIVLADRSEVGYARGSYIVLSRVDPSAPVPLARFICHELAHFWSTSVNFMGPDHWMSEAFAEYVSGRFVRERYGASDFETILNQWESAGRAHGPVWTPESTTRPNMFVMYRRSPWLLHLLEERIGAERFGRFLTSYMVDGASTTPVLLAQLRAAAGADAEGWFREELARVPGGR